MLMILSVTPYASTTTTTIGLHNDQRVNNYVWNLHGELTMS